MALNYEFKEFVLDQLSSIEVFETKNMFGGLALLVEGGAFAKLKHDRLWLKANEQNKSYFIEKGMKQYSYGKDNSRKLNFYETPIDILENKDKLKVWVQRSIDCISK
ncbi:MAG: TfoX/Sxy family protein [Bacteroidia bacterium]